MSGIVGKLMTNDWRIMKRCVLVYWSFGLVSLALAAVGGERFGTAATILFVASLGALGFHTAIQTIVVERTERNFLLIMSLPVSIREYTLAKISVNLLIFVLGWGTLSAMALFLLFAGDDGMPDGKLPFVCIVLTSIFFAYTIVLVTALLSDGLGATIIATVVANLGTQIGLWQIVDLEPIRSTLEGPTAAWNSTSVGLVVGLLVAIVLGLVVAANLRFRKRDLL